MDDDSDAPAGPPAAPPDLAALLDEAAIGMALIDLDGGWIAANAALCETLGRTAGDLRAQPLAAALLPDDGARLRADTAALRAGQAERVRRVARATHRDGRTLTLALSLSALRASGGAPWALLAQAQDLTAQERAAAEARAAETRYRTLVEQIPAIVYVAGLDAEGPILSVSPQIAGILGYTPEEWRADPALRLRQIHPSDRERLLAAAAEVRRGHRPQRLIYRSLTADGREVWLHDLSQVVRDEAGRPSAVQGLIFDITQQMDAEDAAHTSAEQYRSLVETLDSIVMVVDAEGAVRYANAVAAQRLGLPPYEIIGQRLQEVFDADVAAAQLRVIQGVIDGNRGLSVETQVPVDGEQRWHRTSVQPIRDADGRAVAALVNATDIHDLKAAQRELQELNQTLEARVRERSAEVQDLYDHAPGGYHSLDAQGRVAQINETELGWLGRSRAEVVGRPFTDFMTPESQRAFHVSYPQFMERGAVQDLEVELVRRDGGTLPVLVSAAAIYDEAGAFVASRTTLTDLTARRASDLALRHANAELARAARAKDEFLSTMSHELRTPLHGILTLAELLLEQTRGPLNDRQQRTVRGVQESGAHLLALINDVLDMSKIDADRLDLDLDDIPAADACQAALALVRELALRKGITLTLDVADLTAVARADLRRLKQMLVNLLSNAIKFTPAGGSVRLAAGRTAAGMVAFAVADTGIGIAAEDLPKLFRPFTQLDSGLARQQEGTGLGLTLVWKLAELHGGSVAVASEPGAGSTFTLTLPAAQEPQPRQADPAWGLTGAPAPMPAATIRGSVLIVDDTLANRDAAAEYLSGRGYTVWLAAGGEEGIASARAQRPDVILMDIQMPGMDGLEAIRRLRADPDCAQVPVVALTALAMPGDRERGLAAGASAYVTKPVVMRELVALIEDLRRPRG